jgi:hypothetical protein
MIYNVPRGQSLLYKNTEELWTQGNLPATGAVKLIDPIILSKLVLYLRYGQDSVRISMECLFFL